MKATVLAQSLVLIFFSPPNNVPQQSPGNTHTSPYLLIYLIISSFRFSFYHFYTNENKKGKLLPKKLRSLRTKDTNKRAHGNLIDTF
jgi:hypothetical protein